MMSATPRCSHRLSVKDGRLVLPDGMSYRCLVLPDSRRMPVEVVKKIAELVKAGATVLGPKPEGDPGLKDYPRCDAIVRETGNALWGDVDGQRVKQRQVGHGRVVWGKDIAQVLKDDGLKPDFETSPSCRDRLPPPRHDGCRLLLSGEPCPQCSESERHVSH